jgi:uncharacterized protein YkwD
MDGPPVPVDPPAIWAEVSSSPVALSVAPGDPLERDALARCGTGDEGLRGAADDVVFRSLRGMPLPDADALAFAQRAAGEPHPWARAWAASAKSLSPDATLRKLDEWLAEDRAPRLRRCAVASGTAPDGTRALAVVTVEALADLAPLPTRARTGQWLTVGARLRVPASAGAILVLGPGGAPRRVPAWFDGETLRARFALDRPGEFTVQVLATTATGPRPVLDAAVFADAAPPARASGDAAPGEEVALAPRDGGHDSESLALASMLAAARAESGEPPLARDARLDAVALEHARSMATAHALAHDAGDGDPGARMQAAGLSWQALGENVAHGATLTLAHRALWASPSHRANMLKRDFEDVGVAAVRDERGDVWVVETFASGLR